MRLTWLSPLVLAMMASIPSADASPLENLQGLPFPERQATVDALLEAHPSNPVHDAASDTLLLLYRGPGRDVGIAGDWTGWQPMSEFRHVPGTDLWVLPATFPVDARLDYKLVVDGAWSLDPRNPHTMMSGFGPNSELRGPAYRSPWWLDAPGPVPCRLDTLEIATPTLGGSRTVVVAVPPGADHAPRPFLLVHDGLEYLEIARLHDYLAAVAARDPGLPLPICVCVPPVRRTEEYAGALQTAFTGWVVDELRPQIEERYADVGRTGEPWGSLGASYGGRITLDLARRHPDRFDRLAPMSPSVASEQHDGVAALDPTSVRLYVNWGTWDIPGLIPGCERFAGMLGERGFDHVVEVLPQGHSWGLWRDTLDAAFRFLYDPD